MRLSLILLLLLFLVQCSNDSTPEIAEQEELPEHIFILDEIPEHILEVENLTIFPGDSEPRYSIELIPVKSFGETGEPYLTRIMGCVVDDNGRVIILNANTNYVQHLYVYNNDGTYFTQMGGPGRGPGEYGFVLNIQAQAGNLLVRDITNQRLNIYNTTNYSIDRTMLIDQLAIRNHEAVQGLQLGLIMPRIDGNHLVTFSKGVSGTEHKYLLMDTNGNKLNFEPIVFPSSSGLGHIIGQTFTALSNEDALYSIWTMDFLIKKYDKNGEYQTAIYYPIKGLPFDLNEYAITAPFGYSVSDIEKGMESMNIKLPETNPVVNFLMTDDENRIWVAVPMDPQRKMLEWWILDPSGELLAKLQRPSDLRIFDIKGGYLYSIERDEDTDAEYVVKYRIELKESNS